MAIDILTATVTQVPFGNLEIEGLLLETKEFAVGVPQIVSMFPYFSKLSDPQKHGAQELKRLMGEHFKTHKIKAFKQNKYALAVLLPDFEQVLRKLDKADDPVAMAMTDALIGLSLTQIFSDAFNIRFEKEERQAYLQARPEGKVTRCTMTDAIKAWCNGH